MYLSLQKNWYLSLGICLYIWVGIVIVFFVYLKDPSINPLSYWGRRRRSFMEKLPKFQILHSTNSSSFRLEYHPTAQLERFFKNLSADFVSKTRKEKESRNHILRSFSLISYHIRTGLALTALCKSYSQTRASSQRFILSLSSLHCYFLQTQSAPVFQDAEQNPRAELFILPIS